MPRHHPILVHQQLSAQLRAGFLKQPPPAYSALLNHPPAPTPPQSNSTIIHQFQSDHHHPSTINSNQHSLKPPPIRYQARDQLRRAFFRDHPFEAYRPKCLIDQPDHLLNKVSSDNHLRPIDPITGLVLKSHQLSNDQSNKIGLDQWVRLDQVGCLPTAEDCINFAEALYNHHPNRYTLNQAYQISVSQFRTLRFEYEIQTSFGRQEAEYYSDLDRHDHHHKGRSESNWGRDLLRRQVECQDQAIRKGLRSSNSSRSHTAGGNRLDDQIGKTMVDPKKRILGLDRRPGRPERNGRGQIVDGSSVLKELLRKSKRMSAFSSLDTTSQQQQIS